MLMLEHDTVLQEGIMSEKMGSDEFVDKSTGARIPVTTKELGNNIQFRPQVVVSMLDNVTAARNMLNLCDQFQVVLDVPGGDTDLANCLANVALECTALMWFCAGMDESNKDETTREFVREWKSQLSKHDRQQFKGFIKRRNQIYAHRGNLGRGQRLRDVKVELDYLDGDLDAPMVGFNIGESTDAVREFFKRMSEPQRMDLERLMREAANWLESKYEHERNEVTRDVIDKPNADLVTIKGGIEDGRRWLDWTGADSSTRT